MKEYTFMLSFMFLTSLEDVDNFKFFLDDEGIPHKIHSPRLDSCQFVFKNISDREYKGVKNYFYDNLYDGKALFDINDVMFMSFDNFERASKNSQREVVL